MESDTKSTKEIQGTIPNDGNVFLASWVRRIVQIYNEHYRLLLDDRYNFLLDFRIFLWFVFLCVKTFG